MRIALDYDDTFTLDKPLWRKFVADVLVNPNNSVTFVTFRGSDWINEDIEADAKDMGIEIVYTNGSQKMSVFKADVWIDDRPELIVNLEPLLDTISKANHITPCLLYTSPSPRDATLSRMPSSA